MEGRLNLDACVCVVAALIFLSCISSTRSEGFADICRGDGGFYYPGDRSCIKLHTKAAKTWQNSRKVCQKDGGDLVKLTNPEINNFFIDILKGTPAGKDEFYWIGLNDIADEGHYRWLDEKVDTKFTYWKNSEPTNYANTEHCVHAHDPYNNYRWNDLPCYRFLSFACQKPSPPLEPLACPQGWNMYKDQGRCFKVVDDVRVNWTTARQLCQNDEGDLATILSRAENDFVNRLYMPWEGYWIGLNDRQIEGRWQWLDDSSKPYFLSWRTDEASDVRNQDCVIIEPSNKFKWEDITCGRTMGFVCQRPGVDPSTITTVKTTPTTTTPTTTSTTTTTTVAPVTSIEKPCSKRGAFFYPEDQTCMYVSRRPTKWSDARTHCKSEGGDLVKVSSASTNDFMMGIFQRSKGDSDLYWIGLHDQKEEGHFKWLDEQTDTNFTYWSPSTPNSGSNNDNCVNLQVSNVYHWNDANCDTLLPSVCQVPSLHSGPLTCPDGWKLYNAEGRCFKVVETDSMNWTSSRHACQSEGGDLASITSSGVNDFLKSNLSTARNYWIGMNDRQVEGEYRWLDAQYIPAYTSWSYQLIIDYEGQDCVSIEKDSSFSWQKVPCAQDFDYICEQPAKVVVVS